VFKTSNAGCRRTRATKVQRHQRVEWWRSQPRSHLLFISGSRLFFSGCSPASACSATADSCRHGVCGLFSISVASTARP
jgi:hypothetical protein